RSHDLAIELPRAPLTAVMAGEVWSEIYTRLEELVRGHRTTLIFVNTRRLAERTARHLAERLGEENVNAHHGSLSREHRLEVEQNLKSGRLRALVATASLELGIDIGDIDLVCQIGSPRAISTFKQRTGRSGHRLDAVPKGRLFPLSRDELVECEALLRAVQHGELEALRVPAQPLDVLAQQLVAEISAREWDLDSLFVCMRLAWPYRDLSRTIFDQVVEMLSNGFSTRRGRRGAFVHLDAVNGRVRGRRGARLTAFTNAGAIPDQFDYDVLLEPDGTFVGTLNEDFAFESMPADIFQLGNVSYRVLRVERSTVRVEDAHGAPPSIPFWFGESPGRSDVLSAAVSQLRCSYTGHESADEQMLAVPSDPVQAQINDYFASGLAALGVLPTVNDIVFERFFDEAGDMHLVIHAPLGSRINRAWGLALRKRFCRRFNFELQAAATDDCIVLSLGATHSFELAEVAQYLSSGSVRHVLTQALLDAPMFTIRWRWVANIALAVPRFRFGKRVPAPIQRANAEDLVAVLFPDQLACAENITAEKSIPSHPLVNQVLDDCLHEVMDVDSLETLLKNIESGVVRVHCRDLAAPSPLAQEILSAKPYAFLDDAPAEERRTRAVHSRSFSGERHAGELAHLDQDAIDAVIAAAQCRIRSPDELHDALVVSGYLTNSQWAEVPAEFFTALQAQRRATLVMLVNGESIMVAAERLAEIQAVLGGSVSQSKAIVPVDSGPWTAETALLELVRSRLEQLGPVTADQIAGELGHAQSAVEQQLLVLEQEGFILRGVFKTNGQRTEWCERQLLARIHAKTLTQLRRKIKPVPLQRFIGFLLDWQGMMHTTNRPDTSALLRVISRLEGYAAPLIAWESEIFPRRIPGYTPALLDQLSLEGTVFWARLRNTLVSTNNDAGSRRHAMTVRNTPIAFFLRAHQSDWQPLLTSLEADQVSGLAEAARLVLSEHGALFFDQIRQCLDCLPTQREQALSELVRAGLVSSDSFNGLRRLIAAGSSRQLAGARRHRRGRGTLMRLDASGRWSLLQHEGAIQEVSRQPDAYVEHVTRVLLDRYGIVFHGLLNNESRVLPPWRDLVKQLRRLEARGEIRGGRFVAGVSGEQFAVPDALDRLRQLSDIDYLVAVSAADVLNLTGMLGTGARVPRHTAGRILYRGGVCVATLSGRQMTMRMQVDGLTEWNARHLMQVNTNVVQQQLI
ncbi:MAG: helicase-related protein, partial [Pseudomonadota bacterium]|nr:helicase-related protein [Pseudomonadota bacterium]